MTTPNPTSVTADHHRLVLRHAPQPLISTDTQQIIQTINAAACQLLRKTDDVIGCPIDDVLPEPARETFRGGLSDAIQSGEKTEFIFALTDRENPLNATIVPIVDDQQNNVGALVMIRQAAQQIEPAANEAQRTKLTYLGRMAGAFAHYFNNILGGAVTSVSYALSSDDPDLQARTLKHTNDALARATLLLDSLLSFAEGDQKHSEQTELTELIHDVASYIGPEMAQQNISLELKLEPIPKTPVPQIQVITVLENILHNAVDATEPGGTVTIRTQLQESSILLSVTDTGCGIPESQLQRIFEPFFSTKSDVDTEFEHHPGLGLAVAHGMLQVLGHNISVRSTPGVGTTVTIRFNVAEAAESHDA